MRKIILFVLAFFNFTVSPATARTTLFIGDTTNGLTYNRPVAAIPPIALSRIGTAVRYAVILFTVSQSGSYDFLNTSIYDNFLGIHRDLFDPNNALLNALAYDDDSGGGVLGNAAITALPLNAGASYFAVASGFDNSDFGSFRLIITGPGDVIGDGGISIIPESGIWIMFIFGFGFVGGALRSRRVGYVAHR